MTDLSPQAREQVRMPHTHLDMIRLEMLEGMAETINQIGERCVFAAVASGKLNAFERHLSDLCAAIRQSPNLATVSILIKKDASLNSPWRTFWAQCVPGETVPLHRTLLEAFDVIAAKYDPRIQEREPDEWERLHKAVLLRHAFMKAVYDRAAVSLFVWRLAGKQQ